MMPASVSKTQLGSSRSRADEQVAAGGTAAGAYLAKGMTVTKGALIKNSGTIAKICMVPSCSLHDRSAEVYSFCGFAESD